MSLQAEFTNEGHSVSLSKLCRWLGVPRRSVWLHRFESLGQARAVVGRWIRYYNEERPHQSLGYVAPRVNPTLVACRLR